MQFSYSFDEVALSIGTDALGNDMNIALITGYVIVDYDVTREWHITDIWLSGPLMKDPEVKLDPTTSLWVWAERSIMAGHEHEIDECVNEEVHA